MFSKPFAVQQSKGQCKESLKCYHEHQVTSKESPVKLTDCSADISGARKIYNDTFKVLRKEKFQPRVLYLQTPSLKINKKCFTNKKKAEKIYHASVGPFDSRLRKLSTSSKRKIIAPLKAHQNREHIPTKERLKLNTKKHQNHKKRTN